MLSQPLRSMLSVPGAFPEYFNFEDMNLLEVRRACEHEAVWLDEAIFRAGPKGVGDAVTALKKIQENLVDLWDGSAPA